MITIEDIEGMMQNADEKTLSKIQKVLNRAKEQDAKKHIMQIQAKIDDAIKELEEAARKYDVDVHLSGPEYGMGGSYTKNDWNDSGCSFEESAWEWKASSQSC